MDVGGDKVVLEGSKLSGGKVGSCNIKKGEYGRLAVGKEEVPRTWKEYFEDLYNMDIGEQVAIHMCVFDQVQRGKYFGGEQIMRTEVEARVRKLEMIKGGGDMVVDWIWRLCNMAFEIDNYFEGPTERTEMEGRMKKFKKGRAPTMDEATEEMIKKRGGF